MLINRTKKQSLKKHLIALGFGMCSTALSAGVDIDYHIDGFLTAGFGVLTGGQVFAQQLDVNTLEFQILSGLPPLYDTVLVRPSIYNYNGKIDLQEPAILGLNARVDINDKYSFVLQVTGTGNEEFSADYEWAFFEYRLDDNWDFRFGRLRIPLFMFSDTLEVGYTYPWVTPPAEIYQLVNFTSYSGAEMVYENNILGQDLRASLYYGSFAKTDTAAGVTGTFSVRQILAGYINFGNQDIQARAGYIEALLLSVVPTPGLTSIIEAYTTIYGAPDVLPGYEFNNARAHFADVGITIDKNNWLFLAEVVQQGTNTPQFKTVRGWYTTLGYSICGDWLPYVGFAEMKTLDKTSRLYGGPLGAAINPLVSLINTDQKTITMGLRWDVFTNTDFKLQVERIDPVHGTPGLYSVNPHQADYLIRGTVDMVF